MSLHRRALIILDRGPTRVTSLEPTLLLTGPHPHTAAWGSALPRAGVRGH